MTPVGRAIFAKSKEVVSAYDGIAPSIMGDEGFHGEISRGALPASLTGLAPLTVKLLKRKSKELHVTRQSRVNRDLALPFLAEMERGRLDAAIIFKPPHLPTHLTSRSLAEEPMQLLRSSVIR
ncbi:MAG: hypothetical protein OXD29_04005 [Roseovarius sp.]|nr:hypothetical protein [Roseovarius sp.]